MTRSTWVLLAALTLATTSTSALEEPVKQGALRVCADPNNLPFSNARSEGFENRLAELLSRELKLPLQYHWWPQRRGFLRNTLLAGRCDLVLGVPATLERIATTPPYYRSTYTFVQRSGASRRVSSLDDPALADLRIGVQLIGDDGVNTPPVQALARRGVRARWTGFPVGGDAGAADPAAPIVRAVASGELDLALVWGPLAGYYAGRIAPELRVTAISPANEAGAPMTFAISMGVRHEDRALERDIAAVLTRNRREIREILREFRVPLVDAP